jgi:hypothetical protein
MSHPLSVNPPVLSSIDTLTTKATRQDEEKELRASPLLGIKDNLVATKKQQILQNFSKKQRLPAAETHQPLQAHSRNSEYAPLAVEKDKKRDTWKANEAATFPSIASPSINIATMAAEVVRQKKEKEQSEQIKTNTNREAQTSAGAKTWAVKQQKNEVNAHLLSSETERWKRSLVDEDSEPTNYRSSSGKDSDAPCQNLPPPSSVGSQTAEPHQTLLLAVNQVAKQKPQRLEAARKPSKLSLAVAAAAQHRSSTNRNHF